MIESKKYEFTGETQERMGHTLHRIRSLIDFGDCSDVKVGTIGGLIESEKNLSHSGLSWIGQDSSCFGDVLICEDAVINGKSDIYNEVTIGGTSEIIDSEIFGSAEIIGSVKIKNSIISGNSEVSEYANIDHSMVCDNAVITGDSVVRNSQVMENATITKNARVVNSVVYGNAVISGMAKIIRAKICGSVKIEDAAIVMDATLDGFGKYGDNALIQSEKDWIEFKTRDQEVLIYRGSIGLLINDHSKTYLLEDYEDVINNCQDWQKKNYVTVKKFIAIAKDFFNE